MAARNKHTLDTMSITVLLVMAIFGGIVGYYIGRSSVLSQFGPFKDATVMMETMGNMMETKGARYGDKELRESGAMMTEKGGMMINMMDAMMMKK